MTGRYPRQLHVKRVEEDSGSRRGVYVLAIVNAVVFGPKTLDVVTRNTERGTIIGFPLEKGGTSG